MDKESITQYAWIIIATLVFAALVVFASPLGEGFSESAIKLIKGQQEEVKTVYSEESMKEQLNYMEQLFDTTDLQQPGLYKHNDASQYKYSWKELEYFELISFSGNTIVSTGAEKDKLSGDLILSKDITTVAPNSFSGCQKLELIRLGENVITVGENSFDNCASLKTFIPGISLKVIETEAFRNCVSLENVYINNGITTIGDYAFTGCEKLKTIYFDGSTSEWNAISKGSLWYGTAEKVVCSNGTIAL